jgi:hypothetical protein
LPAPLQALDPVGAWRRPAFDANFEDGRAIGTTKSSPFLHIGDLKERSACRATRAHGHVLCLRFMLVSWLMDEIVIEGKQLGTWTHKFL